MQSLLNNWISNSQISPVITGTDTSDFINDWISTTQSNPQTATFSVGQAIGTSIAIANTGSIAQSLANSQVSGVTSAQYSTATITVSGIGTASGQGKFGLNSITFYSLNYWVSSSEVSPAFVKLSDYSSYWITNGQSFPQNGEVYIPGNLLFFGML